MSFHEVTVSKPSSDRRWTGAVSVIWSITVISIKDFFIHQLMRN